MLSLIDGDPIVYKIAFSIESFPKGLAKRVDGFIEDILGFCEATDYKIFLTGDNNFRLTLDTPTLDKYYPHKDTGKYKYKGNREGVERPEYYYDVRNYLIEEHKAIIVSGMDADDALGIEQMRCARLGIPSIIGTIDKDLQMVPGEHCRWPTKGVDKGGKWEYLNISLEEGNRFFYTQLLTGDKAVDNIPGIFTFTKKKASAKLKGGLNYCFTTEDMYYYVKGCYVEAGFPEEEVDALLTETGQLLWMKRDLETPFNLIIE